MFNDDAWVSDGTREQMRRFEAWLAIVRGRRLVVLEIGAGKALPTLRTMGERISQRPRTTLVRINPDDENVDDDTRVLRLTALEALTQIAAVLPERFVQREAARSVALPSSAPNPEQHRLEAVPARVMDEIAYVGAPIQGTGATKPAPDLGAVTFLDLSYGPRPCSTRPG